MQQSFAILQQCVVSRISYFSVPGLKLNLPLNQYRQSVKNEPEIALSVKQYGLRSTDSETFCWAQFVLLTCLQNITLGLMIT